MEQAQTILTIASPIIACIVYILKKDKDNSTKITSTLLDAYVENLRKNSEMISGLTESLNKSIRYQEKVLENQEGIRDIQEVILKKQEIVTDYILKGCAKDTKE